jgi:Polyketide cyclase / dehydrase and lipid transport
MSTNDYHFITHWQVESTPEEISKILEDAEALARWWPSVYLDVKVLEPGDENGAGKLVSLSTKGWLPYTLRWQFRVTESRYPFGFTLQALGDFEGRGIWTFEQEGQWVNITYDWKLSTRKPLLNALSFLLKPVFAANHRWAMARGLESLKLELARLHARSPEEAARIPPPPGPTFPHNRRFRRSG